MASNHTGNGRLDSWKYIAAYLGRDVRTVMRWEKEKALPVRRVPGGYRHAVFAYQQEIDAWLGQGNQETITQAAEPGIPAPGPAVRRYFFVAGRAVADRLNGMKPRERIVGAVFVLAVVTAQAYWMGRGAALLSAGLFIAYLFWIMARWKNDPAAVLPMCLLAIAVQCLHFTEEYLTGFQRQFPRLIGYEWSDARFVAFNMAWLAAFVLAALGVHRRVPLAYLVVLFLALAGGVGNGAGHLLLSATQGRYFPGAATAPLCLLAGVGLLTRLFGEPRARQALE
ncbi:MAG TPA: HXXEE domain-containing protein [Candidatus Angelobacter sp.]